jgi:hypothetical protein
MLKEFLTESMINRLLLAAIAVGVWANVVATVVATSSMSSRVETAAWNAGYYAEKIATGDCRNQKIC